MTSTVVALVALRHALCLEPQPFAPGDCMLTAFGLVAASTMVIAYALESRGPAWIAVFALGCAATAVYGLLTAAWLFAVLESVWAAVALRRFRAAHEATPPPTVAGL